MAGSCEQGKEHLVPQKAENFLTSWRLSASVLNAVSYCEGRAS
jgi:hypothetical protein